MSVLGTHQNSILRGILEKNIIDLVSFFIFSENCIYPLIVENYPYLDDLNGVTLTQSLV